jgi:hypothetical protein
MLIALGIKIAVVRFSTSTISEKAMTNYKKRVNKNHRDCQRRGGAYVRHPTKDVGIETKMGFRDVKPALHQDFLLQRTPIIYNCINPKSTTLGEVRYVLCYLRPNYRLQG